jgi:hypothetical protein
VQSRTELEAKISKFNLLISKLANQERECLASANRILA